jgi:hypothetical protein
LQQRPRGGRDETSGGRWGQLGAEGVDVGVALGEVLDAAFGGAATELVGGMLV